MKRKLIISIILLSINIGLYAQAKKLIDYVNPLVGSLEVPVTDAGTHSSGVEHGRTIPIVGVPNGMTSWVPQTAPTEQKCVCPYYYHDYKFQGFRASHWVNGGCTQDYGSVTIMPISGGLKIKPEERATFFSHKLESSTPAYYRAFLPELGINAEMTGLSHSGLFRFEFNRNEAKYIVVDVNSDEGLGLIQIDPEKRQIKGYNPVHRIYNGFGKSAGFSGYFVIEFSDEFEDFGTWSNWKMSPKNTFERGLKTSVGGYVKLATNIKIASVKVGTSFTSMTEAENNLKAEIKGFDFDVVKERSENEWTNRLGTIQVRSDDSEKVRNFYSAFYMASILPRKYNDVSGAYPMFASDYKNGKLTDGNYYDDFSMWDTYRAVHPLYTIISPSLTKDFVKSLVLKAEQGDWLPIFPCWNSYTSAMIGDHAVSVISDAYVKGICDFDVEKAYGYMRKNAFEMNMDTLSYQDGKGRRALDSYLKYGYIPMEDQVLDAFHRAEQVSRTLEYAYDDFTLAQVAKRLGKTDDYEKLIMRSRNYQNVFDKSTGYVRGRYANGEWITPFDPFNAREKDWRVRFITEASPFQYTWYVPQDVPGLIKLMGGRDKYVRQLDKFFDETHYSHGNEPSHHIAYMYPYAGVAWKTQKLIPEIIRKNYLPVPDGLYGNDDAGQMSAWLMFSMMGFYPVCPGTPEYVIGTPMFDEVAIKLENGNVFKIIAENLSDENFYIQSATLNGENFEYFFINHEDIINGGTIVFKMGNKPNIEWGKIKE